jgi:hypothetical protein
MPLESSFNLKLSRIKAVKRHWSPPNRTIPIRNQTFLYSLFSRLESMARSQPFEGSALLSLGCTCVLVDVVPNPRLVIPVLKFAPNLITTYPSASAE